MTVALPQSCIGRSKEKWRPLKRVAMVAGGRWPAVADDLIARGLNEDADERDAGLKNLPPGMVVLTDLHTVWPENEDFVPTGDLVSRLIAHNPEYWGVGSAFGKPLTEKRFGQLVAQASKVTSQRPVDADGVATPEASWNRCGPASVLADPPLNPVHPAKAVHPVR